MFFCHSTSSLSNRAYSRINICLFGAKAYISHQIQHDAPMKLAIRFAQLAYKENELPVGAVLISSAESGLKVISSGSSKLNISNRRQHNCDAEVEVSTNICVLYFSFNHNQNVFSALKRRPDS